MRTFRQLLLLCVTSVLTALPLAAADPAALLAHARTFPAMPRGTAEMIPFVGGLPTFSSGAPFNDLQFTILDTDYIDGENSGHDTFLPVDPSLAFPGADRVKYIRCALNSDLDQTYGAAVGDRVILGTADHPQPFFLRGPDGVDNDYAVIQHFDYEAGHIQLRGAAADYALLFGTIAEGCATTGWYLFHIASGVPDLVAFIFPVDAIEPAVSGNPPRNPAPYGPPGTALSLTNPVQFRFATPLPATPALPGGIVQFGGAGKDNVAGLTTDASGCAYLVGSTDSNLDGATAGSNEIFVAKVAPDGRKVWITELPTTEGTLLKAAVADAEHLYVAGRTLGALPGFTNAGRWDGILLKLRLSDGAIAATDQWGNPGIDGYGNLALDGAGHLFVSAQGSPPGPATNDNSYLVAKHRTSDLGNVWRNIDPIATTGFAASAEAWGGLTFVPSTTPGAPAGEGRLVVAGWYMANNGANAFAAIYENLAAAAPTRPHFLILTAPGTSAEWILDSAVDAQGRIYFTGYSTGALPGASALGDGDAFVARYSPTLTNPVVRQFGTARSDLGWNIAIDADGLVHVLGYTYGDYAAPNADPTRGTGDIFAQTFDADLNPLRARQFGTAGEERGLLHLNGDRLVIGGLTEGALVGIPHGSFDAFVLALDRRTLEVVPPAPPPTPPGRLVNLSVRARAAGGDATLIAGLSLGAGPGTRPLLVRSAGPSLQTLGVADFLADPAIEFAPLGGAMLRANDDWAGDPALAAAFASAGAFPFAASGSRDAALFHPPGTGAYTATVRGVGGAAGITLAEVYDLGPADGPRLVNLSARSRVGSGEDALIAGFVIGGAAPLRLLVRAVGPSLARFGVDGLLADPVLTIRPLGDDAILARNDDWGGAAELLQAFAAVGAFGLSSDASRDSAVVVELPPGGYTAVVSGSGEGVALVELYELP